MFQYREEPPTQARVDGSNGDGVIHPGRLEDTSFPTSRTSDVESQLPSTRPKRTTYDYVDADGALLYQNVRVEDSTGKRFFQRRPNGRGGWVRGLGQPRMVAHLPYRLPDLLNAPSDQMIVLHEGEKATDAAALSLPGFVHLATGGALSKVKHDIHLFKGRVVVIIQDKDSAGQKQACLAADHLSSHGTRSVRILHLPDLPEKGDCFDWIETGGTSDALRDIIEATPPHNRPEPSSTTHRLARQNDMSSSSKDMMLLLSQLNRLRHEADATLILVHHSNKAGTGERGSSALRGGVDSLIELSGSDGYFSVSCIKSKDARPFDDEHHRLIPVATRDEQTSMVVVPAERVVQTHEDQLTPNQQRVLETLHLETFRDAGCQASVVQEQSRVPSGSLFRTLSGLMALGYVR